MDKTSLSIKSETLASLAKKYNVCTKTLKNWFKKHAAEIGPPPYEKSRIYTPAQVAIIYEIFGNPND